MKSFPLPRIPGAKRKHLLIAGAAILVFFLLLYFSFSTTDAPESIVVPVTRGSFVVSVTTTGELQAKSSIEVKGPSMAQAAGIWQMKISNLVPEGTVVKAGGFVAELDRSEITQKLKESELNVQKFQSQFEQVTLDSALELSKARDELVNLTFVLEEKRIAKEQSIYEAPALQRQAEIDYERAQRNLDQSQKNYVTKRRQSIAKIKAVDIDLMKEKSKRDILAKTLVEFTIRAPADGMVIYAREWSGRKKVVGATINPWDATVATLPDLSVMESVTYVNEVDIQKIAVGQKVEIRLDADPNKKLTGDVTEVANIGEQRPNSDSKVFEVKILVNESDTTLRPAMTTSNTIVIATLDSVLSVPLEAIHAEENRSYVYRAQGGGIVKQEVRLGPMNDNNVVIEKGLGDEDLVYLSIPPVLEGLPVDTLASPLASP
jgi:RND family efflux transporter MFP subunit